MKDRWNEEKEIASPVDVIPIRSKNKIKIKWLRSSLLSMSEENFLGPYYGLYKGRGQSEGEKGMYYG